MVKRLLTPFAAITCVLFLSNCGTIIHGTSQQVSFSSNPTNARVLVDGQQMGQTPVTLNLKRKDKHTVRLELDGYQPYEVAMSRKVDGWIVGNIVFGGLIGLGVDAITGGMYKLSPDQINAEMRDTGISSVLRDGEMFVTVVMEADPEWVRIGQLNVQP